MYKPQTIEQFKVYQYMKEYFEMDAFILSPYPEAPLCWKIRREKKSHFPLNMDR